MFIIITGSGSKHAEDMMTELQGSIQKSLPHQHTMVDSKFAREYLIIDQS
jgi:ribosomal silencing factor RsfS